MICSLRSPTFVGHFTMVLQNSLAYITSLTEGEGTHLHGKQRRAYRAYHRAAEKGFEGGTHTNIEFNLRQLEAFGLSMPRLEKCFAEDVLESETVTICPQQGRLWVTSYNPIEREANRILAAQMREQKCSLEDWFDTFGDPIDFEFFTFDKLGITEMDTYEQAISKIRIKISEIAQDNVIEENCVAEMSPLLRVELSPTGKVVKETRLTPVMKVDSGKLIFQLN